MIKFINLKTNWNIIILTHVCLVFLFFLIWFNILSVNLLIGVVVGLVPSMIAINQKKKDREEDYSKWLMQNKEACAIELVNTFITAIYTDKELSNQKKQDRMLERLNRVIPALVIWASPSLIRQWEELTTAPQGDDVANVTRRGERFIRTVRKDLGNKNDYRLAPGTFWATLVKSDDKQKAYDACKGEKYDSL